MAWLFSVVPSNPAFALDVASATWARVSPVSVGPLPDVHQLDAIEELT